MSGAAVKIEYVGDWKKNLTTFLEKAHATIGEAIVTDAKRVVPVLSGDTKDSIVYEPPVSGGLLPTSTIRATTGYAYYVEVGTDKMAAQPFLKPSLYKVRMI